MVRDRLKEIPAQGAGTKSAVAYFYFRQVHPVSLVNVAIAILDQLYAQLSSPAREVEDLVSKAARNDPVTLFDATSSLLAVTGRLGRSFIIVDALDECSFPDPQKLSRFLDSLRQPGVHMFLTNRPAFSIEILTEGGNEIPSILHIRLDHLVKRATFGAYLRNLVARELTSALTLSFPEQSKDIEDVIVFCDFAVF